MNVRVAAVAGHADPPIDVRQAKPVQHANRVVRLQTHDALQSHLGLC
jgi:hypothetical protein